MKHATRMALLGVLVLLFGTSEPARAQMGQMNKAQVMKMTSAWPKASQDAIAFMTNKYGAPAAMMSDMVIWGRTGPWKRTIVYKVEHPHAFPGPHTDVMQQWIDYKVSPSMHDKLAMYDGSVVVERTAGEISARCDKEGANFLALNLADEIVNGKRSVEDARTMYGEQVMLMKAMKPAPYMAKLLFHTMTGTEDPDHAGAKPSM